MARLVAQSKRLSQFWEMDQRAGENNEGIDVKKGGANSPSAGGVASISNCTEVLRNRVVSKNNWLVPRSAVKCRHVSAKHLPMPADVQSNVAFAKGTPRDDQGARGPHHQASTNWAA